MHARTRPHWGPNLSGRRLWEVASLLFMLLLSLFF